MTNRELRNVIRRYRRAMRRVVNEARTLDEARLIVKAALHPKKDNNGSL